MKSLLTGPDGKFSSKRFIAIISFIIAAVLAFMGKDHLVVGLFLAVTTVVFGIQATTKT